MSADPSTALDSFAVVIPAFNEVESVPSLLRALREVFAAQALQGEILIVDDGSTDGTLEAVHREAAGWQAVRVLRHPMNLGKTEALLTAAANTAARWLVLFDADLQHSPEEIPRMLAKLDEGWDIVTGRKIGHYDKRRVSSVYNRMSRLLFSVPVSDLNSMKAFRRSILDELELRHDWHRFFVVLAHARGYSVTELDITLYPRRYGTSKYGGVLRVVSATFDLLHVAARIAFASRPQRAALPATRS